MAEEKKVGMNIYESGLAIFVGDPQYPTKIGSIVAEIVHGNVVITVERTDEARFGPVSLVVV